MGVGFKTQPKQNIFRKVNTIIFYEQIGTIMYCCFIISLYKFLFIFCEQLAIYSYLCLLLRRHGFEHEERIFIEENYLTIKSFLLFQEAFYLQMIMLLGFTIVSGLISLFRRALVLDMYFLH